MPSHSRRPVDRAVNWAVIGALVALAAVASWPLIGKVADRTAAPGPLPKPTTMSYIVIPHPDDEFQAWSRVEDRPDAYPVFILATRGEETGYCNPAAYASAGYQRGLERPAQPTPKGKWTASCEAARLDSWRNFITDMGRSDPTLPTRLRALGERGPFPAGRTQVCRYDVSTECASDRTAQVWVDRAGRGALVAFDLGDGDLTRDEVAWAIRTVRDNRAALGINTTLPDGALIGGSFYNRAYDCFAYPHPDHRAVHEALYDVDFDMPYQAAPTCKDDPDATWSKTVSEASAKAAFEIGPGGERRGSHVKNYGWLFDPYYPLDRVGQQELFHTHQDFWVRWKD